MVPHEKLLHKLLQCGTDGPLHTWLTCSLTEMKMQVMFESSSSEPASVDSGVPQGTEISPLLFLYHIDNLACAVSSQVRLFADDCLPYQEINTYTDHHILQEDLKRLETWADTWGL